MFFRSQGGPRAPGPPLGCAPGCDATWLRYCDDVISFLPEATDLQAIIQDLNSVDPSIQFTVEEERDMKIAFLDVLIHRRADDLQFSVYRKPTNKDDLIHYCTSQNLAWL